MILTVFRSFKLPNIGIRWVSDVPVKLRRRSALKPNIVPGEFAADQSTIPSGTEPFFPVSGKPNLLGSVRVQGACLQPDPGYYVFAYNLPSGATEKHVCEALCNVGVPDRVTIHNSETLPNAVDSRNIAILRFACISEYEKAVRLENKLFGILCKSSLLKTPSRTMYLEPADRKVFLISNGVDFDHIKTSLENESIYGPESSVLIDVPNCEQPSQPVGLEFPSFSLALVAYDFFFPKLSFTPYRCRLVRGSPKDSPRM